MSSDFTVIVATFGDDRWQRLAHKRAIPSATPQAPVIHSHGPTLHEARNRGLEQVQTEFVVFLDADDQLAPAYIDAMRAANGDLRVPRLQWLRKWRRPGLPIEVNVYAHRDRPDHKCGADCLRDGNFMVIGTAIRTELAKRVGGFEDWPLSEDYVLFSRCVQAGATIERVPGAVYRAYKRGDSRSTTWTPEKRAAYWERLLAEVWA
jgi:glycosyltransferase involved in cell wall biosynthesis